MKTSRRSGPAVLLLLAAVVLFIALGAYQLHLPGLHYDEAKEAGLNAMELVTGRPVTAFRAADLAFGRWRAPLMVQDYIGSLNVLCAVPFLAAGGISVAALRWLPLVIGAFTILLTWRVAQRLGGPLSAAAAALLLAVNPSFIFWSRQGIFVTNITALILMASLLAALRWWERRRARDLWLLAFLVGLGLYAKLLFVWAAGALAVVGALAWFFGPRAGRKAADPGREAAGRPEQAPAGRGWRSAGSTAVALLCFLLPLAPLILFNIRTSGTLSSVFGSLGRSYYGIDNSAYPANLLIRLKQLVTLLRGDHFWYLGGVHANSLAPWLAGLLVAAALAVGVILWRGRRVGDPVTPAWHPLSALLPAAMLLLAVAQSAFTVSDLFITHYALLLPLAPLAGGLAAGQLVRWGGSWRKARRGAGVLAAGLALAAVLLWGAADLVSTVRYHRSLAVSGGHAAHSDAINRLAEYLDRGGLSAPAALDWGIDAPVRFLTAGRIQPVEVFGYAALDAPDAGFAERVNGFLDNPDSVFLLHAPENTVFRGRWEALQALAAARGLVLREEMSFTERSGRPLFVVCRAVPV